MANSIIQHDKCCFITEATQGLHKHHIYFGNPGRTLSEKYGLWVYLRYDWHEYQPYAVHVDIRLNEWFKRLGQRAFERTHSRAEFMRIFGCNYLDEPEGAADYDDPCPAELYRPPLRFVDGVAFVETEPEVLPY